MKHAILFTVSFLCFSHLSAMDKQITFLDLTTIDHKKVILFADYTDSTSLQSMNIRISKSRKLIMLTDPNNQDNQGVRSSSFVFDEPLPLNIDASLTRFIKCDKETYRIQTIM